VRFAFFGEALRHERALAGSGGRFADLRSLDAIFD